MTLPGLFFLVNTVDGSYCGITLSQYAMLPEHATENTIPVPTLLAAIIASDEAKRKAATKN